MNTPIYDFLRSYSRSGTVRAHMPGHKGRPFGADELAALFSYDITEIKGADSLFAAEGIIAESEKNASGLFGSAQTFYSAGGSTLCIQAMLAAAASPGTTVIAARNCHRAFLSACIFLDIDVEWIYPQYESGSLISGNITPDMVEKAADCAKAAGKRVSGVYLTSPDYLGKMQELDEISEVCRRHGFKLLVDNAHGAYLAFARKNGAVLHPLAHGADICCDSAHKTLPVLTGGAYLHFKNPPQKDIKGIMAMFGSTSPSYPILGSLDLCNKYIDERIEQDLNAMTAALNEAKQQLSNAWSIESSEPAKLTVYALPSGLTGFELAEELRKRGVECEYADYTHTVLMFSPFSQIEDIFRAKSALSSVKQTGLPKPKPYVCFPPLEAAMTMRNAALAESETIPSENAVGRICAKPVACCPPGIAAAVSGEIFSEECINILKNYSIFNVDVVK